MNNKENPLSLSPRKFQGCSEFFAGNRDRDQTCISDFVAPALVAASAISSRWPGSFNCRTIWETEIWVLRDLAATKVFLLGPLSWRRTRCVSASISIRNHPYLYLAKHDFILKSPTLVHYPMDHSRFLSLLICKFLLQQWKPGFHHLPFSYLIVHFPYTCIPVSGR